MARIVSSLALASLAALSIGSAHAQSTAVIGGATETTRGYGAQEAPQSLSKLSDPQQELAADWVKDSSGQRVGKVERVETSAKGRAKSVQIALNAATGAGSAKLVTVPARDLRYDSGSNVVVSDLSQSEIEATRANTAPSASDEPTSRR